jgi:hypothetical protein
VFDLAALPALSSKEGREQGEVMQITTVGEYDSAGSRLTCLALAGDVGMVTKVGKVLETEKEGHRSDEEEEDAVEPNVGVEEESEEED